MNQRHSNRLDATRKTRRFGGYVRRAFADVLSPNQNKPSKLIKLSMTNSQEADSIFEQSESVKTKAKSIPCNWKTVIVAIATNASKASSCLLAKLHSIRWRVSSNRTGARKPPSQSPSAAFPIAKKPKPPPLLPLLPHQKVPNG